MVLVNVGKGVGIHNWGVFSVASPSRLWDYCSLAPRSVFALKPGATQDKGGLCIRKLMEAPRLGTHKGSATPKKSAEISTVSISTLVIQVCTKDLLRRLPNSYLRSQLQKYSRHVEEDPLTPL